jgi:desulfoferrodoxin (superoxide reductase-like protein)
MNAQRATILVGEIVHPVEHQYAIAWRQAVQPVGVCGQ